MLYDDFTELPFIAKQLKKQQINPFYFITNPTIKTDFLAQKESIAIKQVVTIKRYLLSVKNHNLVIFVKCICLISKNDIKL